MKILLVVLFCVGLFFGLLDMVRAVFRRTAHTAKLNREAVQFALENFDLLKDSHANVITRESLLVGKFRVAEEHRHHVERLMDKFAYYGHVTRARTSPLEQDVFVMSKDDLERALTNI